ncbi:MAG TPA: hypothetical protein VFN10_10765 [Thermoanaerobaculia bacterium]|nr:hypothetical protein [Thermoanaerobaculia bacterium]
MITDRASRRLWLIAIVVVALLTCGRIWIVNHLHDQGWFTKYVEFADLILAGQPPRARIGDVSPAYLWLIAAFRALGLGLHAIRNAQIVALSAAALLCAYAANRLAGRAAGIAAAVLVLANRAALVVATEVEPEILILLLNAAAVALLVGAAGLAPPAFDAGAEEPRRGKPRSNLIALAGLLVGLSCIARPVALATLLLVALWLFYTNRRAVLPFAGAALLPIVVILLVNRNLTGNTIIMQPGTQLFEGNNALATGCAGVLPRIIDDINVSGNEADYLHVAYRIVAAHATGQPLDPKLSNRYWSAKAFAWMRTYPGAALELFAWKALLTVHHYDVYDLLTTKRKADELSRWPAIPFGIAFVLAVAAFVVRRNRRELLPVLIFAVGTVIALIAFNVSSRQRNALLVPLAVLGGVGVAEVLALITTRTERGLLVFGAIVIASPLLGIEGPPMREDRYNWFATINSSAYLRAAEKARASGDALKATQLAAQSSLFDVTDAPLVSPVTLRTFALATVQATEAPERRFDCAIALEKAGAWRDAELVLATIRDYRPRRENRAVSSVAYYRARAAIHLRVDPRLALGFLDRAGEEAPGDPNVLALRAVAFGDARAQQRLDAMWDPFTRDWCVAAALDDVGRAAEARALRLRLTQRVPEWPRPRMPV